MKKKLFLPLICILIISMPVISAIQTTKINRIGSFFGKIKPNEEDAPYWAEGYINGTWGLRELVLFKMVEIPIGNISGYYGRIIGLIYAFKGNIYPKWNPSKSTNISAIFFSDFLFGSIGDINLTKDDEPFIETNQTIFVGIGDQNVSCFNWRIMGKTGPTFYLKGNFSKFE